MARRHREAFSGALSRERCAFARRGIGEWGRGGFGRLDYYTLLFLERKGGCLEMMGRCLRTI